MAQRKQDLIGMLADRGEEVVGKLAELPNAQRLLDAANTMKDRVDELQKRVRGIDALEQRVAALEKKVDELSGTSAKPKRAAPKRTTTKHTTKPKSQT
jgi:uncharacterized protein involved in exopolysaccharide biosynthesis